MPLPRPLRPTGHVAVAAPASAALDLDAARAGLAALRARGLTVEDGRALGPPHGYLAGTDATRADELNALFRRTDLDAIVCLRGGYGALRLLDRLDYDAARANPTLLVGYSAITAIQLALWAHAGVPSLSGPMVAPDWPAMDADTEALFWPLAGGAAPVEIVGPSGERPRGIQSGEAEGVLLGGNLVLVASLLGTPFLPDLTGAILFLEDVGESPYRIDGLLARLRLAGVLGRLAGLAFGHFTESDPTPGRPSFAVAEVLREYAACVGGPVVVDLPYGHVRRKATLPIGVRARLRADGPHARLDVLSPVAAP